MIPKQRAVLTSLLGLLLASFGLAYVISLERIQRYTLEWFMMLKPNSWITELWQHPSVDINVDIYLFNWTNADQFNNHSVKPRFEEHGPYAFKETMEKVNIVWHNENSTVSYVRKSNFYFDEAASVGDLRDRIVAPNAISAGLSRKIQYWSPMVRSIFDLSLKMYGNEVSMERPADDWLFRGFDTPMIKMSKLVPAGIVPELYFPYERIGYGYPRNGSTQIYGHHNVYTGTDDFNKLGQIARWRYDNASSAYRNCGQIKGSTGEFHPIPLRQGEPISYFLPDLCRELEVDYAGTTLFEGIEAYIYKGSTQNMGNGSHNPLERCYCDNCEEVPTGVLNISTCWYDVPVFVSYPHFYNADPYFVDQVDGLRPDQQRHEMTIILEPKTGMLLDIRARLMVSLLLDPWKHSTMYRRARRNFMPLVWADYKARITPDLLFYMKMLPWSMVIGRVCGFLCLAVGLVLLLWYPRQLFWQKQRMRKIEITNLETRLQSTTRSEQIKSLGAEISPLLVPKDNS